MKKHLHCLLFTTLLYLPFSYSQSSPSTLDVVGWNIEWFGATFEAPANDDLQRENVKKVIRYLDADIYGLTEMVDTAQIRRLVDSLGSNFGYIISDFCSNASAPGTNAWKNGQKLMFLYKRDIFTNVTARGLLRSSATAYTNWASGRFPFLLTANATINGTTRNINFIVIHGKAGSTTSDYDRRRAGAQELKDTLDAQFPNTINIIFGDFNDALNQTISTGSGPETSYEPIVVDSTDMDHYKSITLPLSYAGLSSMINFPNVVDNHVISNEMVPFYIPGSAQIRTDITTVVPDYVTAHNTSDHWPVFSKYNLAGVVSAVPNITPAEAGILVFPNPVFGSLNIKSTKALVNVDLQLMNMQGQILSQRKISHMNAGSTLTEPVPFLASGIYFLQFQTKQFRTVVKLTRQ